MIKLDADELLDLQRLLERFEDNFEGDLPEYSAGNWSRRNLDALIRDITDLRLRT